MPVLFTGIKRGNLGRTQLLLNAILVGNWRFKQTALNNYAELSNCRFCVWQWKRNPSKSEHDKGNFRFSSISQTNYLSLTIRNVIPYDVKNPNNTAVLLRTNGQNGSFWNSVFELNADLCTDLTHLGLTLLSGSPPGTIREIEEFATHICVTREMGAVFHDAYMRH